MLASFGASSLRETRGSRRPSEGNRSPFVFYDLVFSRYFCCMDTTIINPLPHLSLVLTSALYSIKASTTNPKVRVEIIRDPAGDSDCFFSTELYSINGIVELSDIGSIIEEQFRLKSRISDIIEIRFDNTSTAFTAVYCEYILDPDFDCTKCFLTASAISMVHRNSPISLSHFSDGSSEYIVNIVGHDRDGIVAAVSRKFIRKNQSLSVSFSVNEIIEAALAPAEGETPLVSVAYFAITYASFQKIFYVVEHPFFLTFLFRNMFNADEYVDIVCTVTRKTEIDSETAICDGRLQQYDRVVSRTYNVQTGPLTDNQVSEIEQLIASHLIRLCTSDYDFNVIITDHTVEVDNDDETLHSIKFSFRFTDSRPRVVSSDLRSLMPSSSHVFSNEFSAEFA